MTSNTAVPTTPAATWRVNGEPDPHGTHYDGERAALTLGKLTDDELANGVFMNADQPMNIERILARDPDYHAPIVWLTAAKERIRWLSRALERARAPASEVQAEAVRYFVYDHEGGYNEFKADAEREQGHQAAIDAYLDTGCDGWSEEVTQVVSGIVTHKTVKTDEEHKPAPCAAHPDHDDESCDDCAAWNEWPNHDFETCCRYVPEPLAAPASSSGDMEVGS